MNLEPDLARRQQQVDRFLERCVPSSHPDKLTQAMRYSLFSGGKRIRPILALATSDTVGGEAGRVLPFACAIELIHTYSLIHDDLPAMDDDALRRGKPTSHMVFGEGLAILAGDGLLTEAFRVMAEAMTKPGADSARGLLVLTEIAKAAGARGMVGGQAADMDAEHSAADLPTVEWIHIRKTGALIRAAVRAGALLGGAQSDQLRRLTRYADGIGLAFQIADDILDAEGSTDVTGKHTGRDQARHKATFPALLGVSGARERAHELLDNALRELRPFREQAEPLRALARFVVGRACPRLMPGKRVRVDKLLVDRGLVGSRDRARRLVMSGDVWVGDQRLIKPSDLVTPDAALDVRGADIPFVSRGGLKLQAALAHWNINVRGWFAVDIGASTGGFTDCLLQRGAEHVFAIDVGYGQFAWKLRQDTRVTLFERTNIRTFKPSRLPQPVDLAVIDASFISLRLVLPAAIHLLRQNGRILALVKPQFEVGKGEVGKGGVVRDPAQHVAAVQTIQAFGEGLGLSCKGVCPSPIAGPKGNREFFLYFALHAA